MGSQIQRLDTKKNLLYRANRRINQNRRVVLHNIGAMISCLNILKTLLDAMSINSNSTLIDEYFKRFSSVHKCAVCWTVQEGAFHLFLVSRILIRRISRNKIIERFSRIWRSSQSGEVALTDFGNRIPQQINGEWNRINNHHLAISAKSVQRVGR
jgi:hypothetical protein